MDDWKIDRRRKACSLCTREFASEESHYSAILEAEDGFQRRDYCAACWESKTETPFSYWHTRSPKRVERRLEDLNAMTEFMKRLLAAPSEDPLRIRITYLTALLLMRKKRLKLAGQRPGRILIEKSWDGEIAEIVDPPIGPAEVDTLRLEMEKLFDTELAREDVTA